MRDFAVADQRKNVQRILREFGYRADVCDSPVMDVVSMRLARSLRAAYSLGLADAAELAERRAPPEPGDA